jgi:hypothetical protein
MTTLTSKYPPFSKLHIELLELFEGSRTFTNFIEPLLPKNRTEQPWLVPNIPLELTKTARHFWSTGLLILLGFLCLLGRRAHVGLTRYTCLGQIHVVSGVAVESPCTAAAV